MRAEVLWLLRALRRLACVLPERWVGRLGRWLGLLAFHVLRIRRRVTLGNLRSALRLEEAAARRLAARVYIHLGTGTLELLRVSRLTAASARSLLGEAGVRRLHELLAGEGARRSAPGLLVLSAHLGHWDLLACAAARCGLPVNVVTRSIKSTAVNRFWMEERQACGVRLLPATGSARAILNALRRGEAVAMLIDQHEPGGEEVTFFGRPARASVALARLARATRARVVPVFLLRRDGGFALEVGEPLPLRWSDDYRADLRQATQAMTGLVERAISEQPEQWLWLHRRWKGSGERFRPEGTGCQVAKIPSAQG